MLQIPFDVGLYDNVQEHFVMLYNSPNQQLQLHVANRQYYIAHQTSFMSKSCGCKICRSTTCILNPSEEVKIRNVH